MFGIDIAVIAAWAAVASAAVGAYASYQASDNQKKVSEYNAKLAESKAQDEIAKGQEQAAARQREARIIAGQQRVDFASKGLDIGEGSVDTAIGQTDFFGQVDAATETTNARKLAWNARAQRNAYQAEAANQSPWRSTALSLVGDSGSVARSWYQYKKGA